MFEKPVPLETYVLFLPMNLFLVLCVYYLFPSQAVVLFAMGGYGTYLGFRIRYSDDIVRQMLTKHVNVTRTVVVD